MRTIMPIVNQWQFRRTGTDTWLSAAVPGTVHTDLLSHQKIPDPFFCANENDVQWIENEDWEYRTGFFVSPENILHTNQELFFQGLDTCALVSLNEKQVLTANNMFREWTVACGGLLQSGKNRLHIRFFSPVKKAMAAYEKLPHQLPAANELAEKKTSVFTRKAPYQYGWDWGPRLVTSGIWRSVFLRSWSSAIIRHVRFRTRSLTSGRAELTTAVEIEADRAIEVSLAIRVEEGVSPVAAKKLALTKGHNHAELVFSIDNPILWWPHGLGGQKLYQFGAELSCEGEILDEVTKHIGLRTIEILEEPDDKGVGFCVAVNGMKIFMKGADYIPQDSFTPRVSAERYRKTIAAAKDAHMNMLRVWGGGIYEEDLFYDLCDEAGILVWQDFMFACSLYPGDAEFLENVREEAICNIRRLQHHACLALWCGNNEIEAGWHHWGWQDLPGYTPEVRERVWQDYLALFHKLLPETVRRHDEERFYWPSSPNIVRHNRSDPRVTGDHHYWGVWHKGEPLAAFEDNVGRFMSEFGFQSFPDYRTIEAFSGPEDREAESAVMRHHQRNAGGNSLIRDYMQKLYPVPVAFDDFVYVSQVLQARAITAAIEAHRRAKPFCMGSLYWQLNDCWPVVSWSSLDYFYRPKALQYKLKRAFAPLLLCTKSQGGDLSVFLVSDLPERLDGDLVIKLIDFTGRIISAEKTGVAVPENTSLCVRKESIDDLLGGNDPAAVYLRLEFWGTGGNAAEYQHYFSEPVTLQLQKPRLETLWKRLSAAEARLTIVSDTLVREVCLSFGDLEARLSDNFFDLEAKVGKSITIQAPVGIEKLEQALRFQSLNAIQT